MQPGLEYSARRSVRSEAKGILAFIGVMWLAFVVDLVVPVDLNGLGLVPRTARGLIGIPMMPFLHANLGHLISNTLPLLVLLGLLAGSRSRSWEVVLEVIVLAGLLLWVAGRPAIHIGASGLVFGLAAFLVVSGLIERRPVALAVAGLVLFLYGGSLLAGMLPWVGSQVSWDGHLCGALAGGLVACKTKRASNETSRIDS